MPRLRPDNPRLRQPPRELHYLPIRYPGPLRRKVWPTHGSEDSNRQSNIRHPGRAFPLECRKKMSDL